MLHDLNLGQFNEYSYAMNNTCEEYNTKSLFAVFSAIEACWAMYAF